IMAETSTKDTSGTTAKIDGDVSEWHLSTAVNSRPNADTLLVLGIGIESSSEEAKLKPGGGKFEEDAMRIPLNVGLEHHTFKKVTTRFGISKPLYDQSETKDTIVTDTESESLADGEATVSAGIGVHVGDNFEIDFVVNQDVLFTGSYFVSGIPESLNAAIGLAYRFN
ncbi:MAG TPA: hypothetical protein VIU33_06710, partial [Nitrospiria bacterium]